MGPAAAAVGITRGDDKKTIERERREKRWSLKREREGERERGRRRETALVTTIAYQNPKEMTFEYTVVLCVGEYTWSLVKEWESDGQLRLGKDKAKQQTNKQTTELFSSLLSPPFFPPLIVDCRLKGDCNRNAKEK